MTSIEATESELQTRGSERLRCAPKNLLLWLLRAYKSALSPMFLPSCRYVPTCSDYAAEAVEKHGAIRGTTLAVWRLVRCHPFVRGGFDPVPNRVGIARASGICSRNTH
jgi:putative membrane protein insertion efficiency factor